MTLSEQISLEQAVKNNLWGNIPKHLFHAILDKIETEKKLKELKSKIFIFSGLFVLSLVLLAFTANSSYHAMSQNSTYKYLSLLFSDFEVVTHNWQDFAMSVLEAMPLGSLGLLLGSILIAFWLIDVTRLQFNNFKKISAHAYNKLV